MTRERCYCPENPQITCAACAPVYCSCGRKVPVSVLRVAYKRGKGVRCSACGERKPSEEVAIEYLGL